ncbi:transposase [Flavobacterium branchiarum]
MYPSLDETSLSNGELYTVLTNKEAKKKGAIVAIVKGTKAEVIIELLNRIPHSRRDMVKEVTVDMAPNMNLIIKKCFPKSQIVTDRFHVQKLATQAVQEERIKLRWEIIEQENIQYEKWKNHTIQNYSQTEILKNSFQHALDKYCLRILTNGHLLKPLEHSYYLNYIYQLKNLIN